MFTSIQDLREERSRLANRAKELTGSEDWNDDAAAEVDSIFEQIDKVDARIDKMQRSLNLERENREINEPYEPSRITAALYADRQNISEDQAAALLKKEHEIFDTWVRGGLEGLTDEQNQFIREKRAQIRNVMSTTTDAEGGYLVPDDFAGRLLEELAEFGGMRTVSTVIRTQSGNAIDWPTVDETSAVGELVAENASTTGADPSFGTKQIAAWKYSSKSVAVPFELLQDNRVNLERWLNRALRQRLARITNQHFTTGDGTSKPNGIVTASSLGKTGATGQTATIIYDDLVDLEHSVDPAYRAQAGVGWMMHDNSLAVIKKLKDDQSRPLWMPGVASSEPNTILGYPYTINQDVATMAANAKSVLFGALSNYLIRDVLQVMFFRMTDSAFTTKGQVGFLAFIRTDGELLDVSGASVKHYANSAT